MKVTLTEQVISDWLSTALTGSFWAGVGVDNKEAYKACQKEDDCLEDHIARYLMADNKNTIEIYDIEGDEDYTRHISIVDIKKGFSMASGEVDIEDMDLFDADMILQLACFDEIIFG